jgi:hypothetical protein
LELAAAGKGVARGGLGTANKFRVAGAMGAPFVDEFADPFIASVEFVVLAAAVSPDFVASLALSLRCCAHNGRASIEVIATVRHNLRIFVLQDRFL